MEVKMVVNGMPVTITVRDAAEAGQLLASMQSPKAAGGADVVAGTGDGEEVDTQRELSADDKVKIAKALQMIQGLPSSHILSILVKNPKGAWDKDIKKLLKDEGIVNLAPHLAHISKMCKKSGVDPRLVVQRRIKRLGHGKVAYNYKLTDGIAALIQAIPHFETQRGMLDFDDEDE